MDSGLGSDEEQRRGRTKEQKQRHNQQLASGCFSDGVIDNGPSITDAEELERRSHERRQGALLFRTSIPQFSTVHMPECTSSPPDTPYNSIVHIDEEVPQESAHKPPLGFYVDLNEMENPEPAPTLSTTSEKKNIFSMVIDFQAAKKDMPNRLKRSRLGSSTSSNNGDPKECNSGDVKCNSSSASELNGHGDGTKEVNGVVQDHPPKIVSNGSEESRSSVEITAENENSTECTEDVISSKQVRSFTCFYVFVLPP